ncbi:MAG TPA: hypothetical protein VE360_14320 [Pyrinomonadaceae bacterium]|nr:hypothetical protein [Pyrinomonadaceae bacterium]
MLSQAAYDRSNTLPLMLALACALLCAGCGAPNEEVGGGSLSVEARVAAGSDARPLDGETLYLLDADPILLAMAEVNEGDAVQVRTHREHPRLRMLAGLMNARRLAAYRLGTDIAIVLEQSKPLWETHVVRTARTDERGRAVFDKLAPGHYWLMCLSERDGKLAFWNPRVTVGLEPRKVVLDEGNALTVSEAPVNR